MMVFFLFYGLSLLSMMRQSATRTAINLPVIWRWLEHGDLTITSNLESKAPPRVCALEQIGQEMVSKSRIDFKYLLAGIANVSRTDRLAETSEIYDIISTFAIRFLHKGQKNSEV